MPSAAIRALHSTDTTASGAMMHSTAFQERNIRKHIRVMAPKMATSISTSACSTASLAAAITPALPPARRKASATRNSTARPASLSFGCSAMKRLISLVR
ncbi:hypothetical protein D3C86_1824330 [compost metagenome]